MGKRLLMLVVHGDAAHVLAGEYAGKLGMHAVATHRREMADGTSDAVVMAGAEVLPYLGVFSGRGPASAASRILDVYPPGLRRIVYLTREYERDVDWLRARGAIGDHQIAIPGAGELRHAVAMVPELGMMLDVIDEPADGFQASLLEPVVDALMEGDLLAPTLANASPRVRAASHSASAVPRYPATHVDDALATAELDHMAIYVSDMAAADRVVRDLLGQEYVNDLSIPLKVSPLHARTFRDPSGEPRTRFVITLCHSEKGRVPDWIALHGSPGVHHLAHRVAELDDALRFARDAGATQLSAVAEVDWLRQVMMRVTDDGFLHELIWRTDDRALDEANALRLIVTQ